MNTAERSRLAPHVICVPPPEGEVASTRTLCVIAVMVGVAGLIVAAVAGGVAGAIIAPAALAAAAFLVWLPRPINRSYRRKRAEFLASLEDVQPHPLTSAVAAKWPSPNKIPKPEVIRDVLRASECPNPERAHVVCLGMIEPPEVSDAFFEPEIVTPTRAIGSHLWFIPPAVAILALWFLQIVGIIPGRTINIGSFGYILVMGVSAGVLWVWRSAIRPTYIRMAPGVIQILEYHHRRGKPTIRGYPLAAGTLAVVRGPTTSRKPGHITLTLMRGEQKDTIEISRMRKRDAIVERAWQALLSTAPTPPLSDEELLG